MYSIFVRNHSEEGNFKGVERDLDRIKALGVDIIWLMPIHPIGKVNRKGILGSPYAIEDYRKINEEYGTLEDFKRLAEEIHKRGMKLVIDVVYNHTAHNSTLYKEHPDWFYRKEDGSAGNKVGDWSDIIDLAYENKELWDYQIETLKYWVKNGVDGFRCDVGSLVPIEFWKEAKKRVGEKLIWLCESLDTGFHKYLSDRKIKFFTDSQMYEAFDITYDYDTYVEFIQYLGGKITLEEYLEKKRMQQYIYPEEAIKLRFLENHDHIRAAKLFKEKVDLNNWTAFMFFQKGMSLIYAGQEFRNTKAPSLFNKDVINREEDSEFIRFIQKLISIKKRDIFVKGNYEILKCKRNGIIEATYKYKKEKIIGLFNVERRTGYYDLNIKDGNYKCLISGENLEVRNGELKLKLEPIILKIEEGV